MLAAAHRRGARVRRREAIRLLTTVDMFTDRVLLIIVENRREAICLLTTVGNRRAKSNRRAVATARNRQRSPSQRSGPRQRGPQALLGPRRARGGLWAQK